MDVEKLLSEEAKERYEQLELIGEGGMGSVFRARDTKVVRSVVLKFPRADKVQDHFIVKRFETEALALAKLDHPNIVRLYDLDKNDGHPFIVTEDVSGQCLKDIIERQELNAHGAIELLTALARGVEAAHRAKIIHRDIKPENVLVTPDGIPKLIDFGFAMSVDGQDFTRMTKTGNVVGTFLYMAPEVLIGVSDASEKSDLYSFGLLAYEVLTGQHPYAGVPLEMICNLSSEIEVLPPSLNCENLDSNIDKLIDELINRDPDKRLGSARAMRRRFERWLQRSGVQAEEQTVEISAVTRKPKPKRKESSLKKTPAPPATRKETSQGRKLLLIAMFLIVSCLLLNFWLEGKKRQEKELALRNERATQAKRETRVIELRDWLLAKPPSFDNSEFQELSQLLPQTKVSKRLGTKVKIEPAELFSAYFLARSAEKSLPPGEQIQWYGHIIREYGFQGSEFVEQSILPKFFKLVTKNEFMSFGAQFVLQCCNEWNGERGGKLVLAYLRKIVPPRDYKGSANKKVLVRKLRPQLLKMMQMLRKVVTIELFEKIFFHYIEFIAYTSDNDQAKSVLNAVSLLNGLGPKYWSCKMHGAESLATLFDPPVKYLNKALALLDEALAEAPVSARDLVDTRRAYAKTLIAARIHRGNGDSRKLNEEALQLSQDISMRSKGKKHHTEVLIFRILTMSRTLFTAQATKEDGQMMSRLFELIDDKQFSSDERFMYLYAKAEVLQNRGQFQEASRTIKEGIACAPYSHKSGMLAIVTYYDIARGIDVLGADF